MESADIIRTNLIADGRQLGKAMRAGLVGVAIGAGAGVMSINQITQLPESAWTSIEPKPPSLEDDLHSTNATKPQDRYSGSTCEWQELTSANSHGIGPEIGRTSPSDRFLKRDETDRCFAALVRARAPRRSREFSLLIRNAPAHEILDVALRQYEIYGYEGRLSLAADLLGEMGNKGWKALMELCEKGPPECAYFVDVIAAFRGVRRAERVGALKRLAGNPDAEVRAGVLNSQRYRPDCFDPSILDELRNMESEDEHEEFDRIVKLHTRAARVI